MTDKDDQQGYCGKEKTEFLRFAITGRADEWSRLNTKLFSIIDAIAARVRESTDFELDTIESSADMAKDLASIASKWVQAKVKKPSLENEKLRAEIAAEFAQAKLRLAEARKAESESKKPMSRPGTLHWRDCSTRWKG